MSDISITPEKAYNKGCMWGMSGKPQTDCPFDADSDEASHWLRGWHDGYAAWLRQRQCQVG